MTLNDLRVIQKNSNIITANKFHFFFILIEKLKIKENKNKLLLKMKSVLCVAILYSVLSVIISAVSFITFQKIKFE